MKDLISIERAKLLHPAIRQEVQDIITDIESKHPFVIRIVQGLRTIDEQNTLYAQGRTAPGAIVTKAKGGSSFHNYGLAIDFALLYDGKLSWDLNTDFDHNNVKDWDEVVNAFKAKGYEWGGVWKTLKDYPHLQKTFSLTWQRCLAKYDAKQFIADTKYISLTT